MIYFPADRPTLYFIGVTTAKSSIMKVFPAWATYLDLGDVAIKGIDLPLHASRIDYRTAVEFIKRDPLSLGALVTTHKIDLFSACRDLFDEIDPHAQLMGETSCLSKRNGVFVCHAKDPISSGLALDTFLPHDHFRKTRGAVFSMGAGGSTIAITCHLLNPERRGNLPSRVIVSNRSEPRLDELRRIHQELKIKTPIDYTVCTKSEDNDVVLASLPPGSLVINATGLGKDAPGSPLSDSGLFPRQAIAWDLNYRGDLIFLKQARAQQSTKVLQIEDGWTYFIHGWTQVISEVFHIDIPIYGPRFDQISSIAANNSGK